MNQMMGNVYQFSNIFFCFVSSLLQNSSSHNLDGHSPLGAHRLILFGLCGGGDDSFPSSCGRSVGRRMCGIIGLFYSNTNEHVRQALVDALTVLQVN